jgi:hypothetical protein
MFVLLVCVLVDVVLRYTPLVDEDFFALGSDIQVNDSAFAGRASETLPH